MNLIQRLFFTFMALLFVGVGFAVYVLVSTGQFDTFEVGFTGHCVAIEGLAGAEDIIIDPQSSVAFISSVQRRMTTEGDRQGRGAIYLYDLKNPALEPVNLTPHASADFRPAGLSYYPDENGSGFLFVINRTHDVPFDEKPAKVIIYRWEQGALDQIKTVEVGISPSNIVATGPAQFYVTNDFAFAGGIGADLQKILALPVSEVGYFDGQDYRAVASGLAFANGIARSRDGNLVFVAETLSRQISVFERNSENGELTLQGEIPLQAAPDNINVDEEGQLWIAGHPQLLSLYGHRGDAGKLSPSYLMTLERGAAQQYVIKDLMRDAGDLISGASVVAPIGDRFLVGAPFENKILDCSR
ncbi:SMP-30/gluconolactonase/LRE family protein [Sneathiella glossodoripedis]|uniref:SMP-30/gluconolactonase/LRE family protein n=1 Tax=Sneathiella glossodoripedis TaxID=418853 RepID=UPI00046F584C|nr:SMP-30/gluconolactonase/LRE family protein [Sneathiella glossodoripedis]